MPFVSLTSHDAFLARQRRRPLAATLAALLACAAPCVPAAPSRADSSTAPRAPRVVGNCNDAGSGSLRAAVLDAVDGDTIDLSQLSCSVISLSTGAILIAARDLTLHGPGADALSIDSAGQPGAGVLYSLVDGTLKVQDLSVSFGRKYGSSGTVHGGCIFSLGNIELDNAHVYACTTHSTGSNAGMGGAVYAQGSVKLVNSVVEQGGVTVPTGEGKGGCVFAGGALIMAYSTITDCRVAAGVSGRGGGAYAGGGLVAKYSTISDNLVDEALDSSGGGLHTIGNATILWSTISGNHAHVGGGLYLGDDSADDAASIVDSTISGNTAGAAGGIAASLPLSLYNSTIVFNTVPFQSGGILGYQQSAGLSLRSSPVRLESSIIAGNIAQGTPDVPRDVGGQYDVTVTGSNNLINYIAQGAPAGTIDADPRLGPLRGNGGWTATHALLPGSPAIDAGNNTLDFSTDQRGAGFDRVLNGVADIGAYERDPDRIFDDGFD
ncbi:MAG: choice-of-anchor Q domain-containing protein [Lysobacterales bacterium]